MKIKIKISVVRVGLVMLLSLSGCAYQNPPKEVPQATLHMVTNLPHLATAHWNIYTDDQCKNDKQNLGNFSKLYDPEKRVQLRAGETRYVQIIGADYGPGKTFWCVHEYEITPVEGKTYRTELIGSGAHCTVKITDETGQTEQRDIHPIALRKGCQPGNSQARSGVINEVE